jgi:hypothetical protein
MGRRLRPAPLLLFANRLGDFVLATAIEGLDDDRCWRDFLGFVERHLKPEGLCLILCPNYGFPL